MELLAENGGIPREDFPIPNSVVIDNGSWVHNPFVREATRRDSEILLLVFISDCVAVESSMPNAQFCQNS
jgi:hypothetical protein